MKKYDIVIGLETHVELNTKTKLLCGCENVYGAEPNTKCCPICYGSQEVTPTSINQEAVRKTIIAGIALGCKINETISWDRKYYSYVDCPKGYQTTQLNRPTCVGGGIMLKNGKFAEIKQIHLEEDVAKLSHNPLTKETLMDFNRSSVPLIEIVTQPIFSTAAEVVEYLEEVRSRLVFSGVADCKMEEGGMRCDVSLSVKPAGSKILGERTETKNLNSFKMIARAIEFEAARQIDIVEDGGKIELETRKWDDNIGETVSMRKKEKESDYNYTPDPVVSPVEITAKDLAEIKSNMPVLAYEYKEKLAKEYGLPQADIEILTSSKEILNYYLECVKLLNEPKKISNWIMVDLLRIIKNQETDNFPVSSKHLTQIIKMVVDKLFTKTVGLQLLDKVIETKKEPAILAKELGLLTTISDEQILSILKQLKTENPKVADDYKVNKDKVEKFIMGYVMKNTQGKAKSEITLKLIDQVFGK